MSRSRSWGEDRAEFPFWAGASMLRPFGGFNSAPTHVNTFED
jgi:hypothetical protein